MLIGLNTIITEIFKVILKIAIFLQTKEASYIIFVSAGERIWQNSIIFVLMFNLKKKYFFFSLIWNDI